MGGVAEELLARREGGRRNFFEGIAAHARVAKNRVVSSRYLSLFFSVFLRDSKELLYSVKKSEKDYEKIDKNR